MSILSVCAGAVGAVILILIIRQLKNDIAMPISVCITTALSITAIVLIEPISTYVSELAENVRYGQYVKVMMKSLAVALVTSSSADICRDCGEGAIASKVELVGKCSIMLISLPLIKSLLTLAEEIMYA
ncbi:MAG: hypothetical protein E7626_03835 [Ruminococcaceae bacterium]|nr:hypothetical protein [Oscillospiraceae bacterium]